MQKEKHPEAFVRTLFTIRIRSTWSVGSDFKFIRIVSEDNSLHVLKSDVTGYGLDEPEDRTCVFILTRGALYRLFTSSNADGPLLLRKIHEKMVEARSSFVASMKRGIDALIEDE